MGNVVYISFFASTNTIDFEEPLVLEKLSTSASFDLSKKLHHFGLLKQVVCMLTVAWSLAFNLQLLVMLSTCGNDTQFIAVLNAKRSQNPFPSQTLPSTTLIFYFPSRSKTKPFFILVTSVITLDYLSYYRRVFLMQFF